MDCHLVDHPQTLAEVLLSSDIHYYDRIWMKTMLQKARRCRIPESTLIVGSSYALNDIQERFWNNAISCSMHSQDLYYDLLCVKKVLGKVSASYFTRCFIIMGYYMFGTDLSLSVSEREKWISSVYYPILHDAHHWEQPIAMDIWAKYPQIPKQVWASLDRIAQNKVLETGSYYSPLFNRWTPSLANGHTWSSASEEERIGWAYSRAGMHNKQFYHNDSVEENFKILNELIHFIHLNEIEPVIIIAPFSTEYNRFISQEMKLEMERLLDILPEAFHYVDFNESDLFDKNDFSDPDHMNEHGAEKMSRILVEMFGE